MRRTILRHAFVMLTLAFLIGLGAGAMAHHPNGRLWMGSHLTGILVSLMVAAVGLVWPELRLGPRASRVLFLVTVPVNYYLLATLGVVAPVMGVPQAIATPQLPAAAAWAVRLTGFSILVATLSSLTLSALVVYGLRGERVRADPLA
jgi:hypothetical protein